MTAFNWCHGPECHEKHKVDRVRGVKGSKVLRTRKVKTTNWNEGKWYNYFCSQRCYDDFAHKHIQQVLAIAPRTECLETPIEDPKKTRHNSNYGYSWNQWDIKVDNSRSTDVG